MIFNGKKWRKTRSIITIGHEGNYILFGKIVKEGKTPPKKAVLASDYKWPDSDDPVYAIPIENNGHSLTNMMYGPNELQYGRRNKLTVYIRAYLVKDGICYTTKWPHKDYTDSLHDCSVQDGPEPYEDAVKRSFKNKEYLC